ncbi:MAG: major facilitator superfamily protein [Comamonadaceae bacterium]|nr:MAG: major facilitator superfamily protein [Comamonadaceae bacterium]
MSPNHAPELTLGQIFAALAVGTIAVLMIGVQPILLGELVEAKQVSLEGVGIVAMGEIVTLGLGVVLGDAVLPWSRLKLITIVAAVLASSLDMLTLLAVGDGQLTAVRMAAGLAEGILIWGTTGVVVRTSNPARLSGIFFVVQTIAQAALGAALANLVIPHAGWKGGFMLLGGLTLLPCVLAFWQPPRLAPLASKVASGFRWSASTVLPLLVVFMQMATLGSFWAYLEPLGKAAGLDAQAAQTLIAGVLVMQVVGGIVATVAVRHLAVVPALVAGSVVLALITTTVYQLPSGSALNFSIACAVFGFVWLFLLPFHIGLAFRADPSGRLSVLVPAAQLLGSAFGPLMASLVVQGEDATAVPMISAAFAVAAGLVVLITRRHGKAITSQNSQPSKAF